MQSRDTEIIPLIRNHADLLHRSAGDLDPLIGAIGDRRFVLIGEASHGTHEFYRIRALLSQRLIREKGFDAVAVEADWPDAYRASRFVQGRGEDRSVEESLLGFARFPTWMWRNTDVVNFLSWLREHNLSLPRSHKRVGFYGLDLYSMYSSIQVVLEYLEKVDPAAAKRARYRYGCLEHYGEDTQAYGYAATFGLSRSCEEEVVSQLVEMRRRAADLSQRDGRVEPDEFFHAEQNARLVMNAEEYYRNMFARGELSWNLRDSHMDETLAALEGYLGAGRSKIIVWAHNSHLGDARATEMSERGEHNLGQLTRQRYGSENVFLLGFTTYEGTVTAASDWGGAAERKRVRPGLPGSYEQLFHSTGIPAFALRIGRDSELRAALRRPRLERAIGVIYLPGSERVSHYFEAKLAEQFDAVIHLDRTQALKPLEITPQWQTGEPPETYPTAV
jgi:erythromycin esterase-like protein